MEFSKGSMEFEENLGTGAREARRAQQDRERGAEQGSEEEHRVRRGVRGSPKRSLCAHRSALSNSEKPVGCGPTCPSRGLEPELSQPRGSPKSLEQATGALCSLLCPRCPRRGWHAVAVQSIFVEYIKE